LAIRTRSLSPMRISLCFVALLLGTLYVGVLAPGCSDDAAHVTYIGSIDASPIPPRLGRPDDAGSD
jgi:hypothetical protein